MKKVLVATQNPGKIKEFRALLAPISVQILFPVDLGLEMDVVEDGSTYAENAIIKARTFARAVSGRRDGIAPLPVIVLADDSGLEVDALDGAPGIRSARYTLGTDTDRLTALLQHLEGVPSAQRSARFRCIVAIIDSRWEVHTAEGVCEGVIIADPAGEGGFGYDPIFYLPDFGCTMAELPAETKNQISHRARAIQAAVPILQRLLAVGESKGG